MRRRKWVKVKMDKIKRKENDRRKEIDGEKKGEISWLNY